jgi:hypothetical protein
VPLDKEKQVKLKSMLISALVSWQLLEQKNITSQQQSKTTRSDGQFPMTS